MVFWVRIGVRSDGVSDLIGPTSSDKRASVGSVATYKGSAVGSWWSIVMGGGAGAFLLRAGGLPLRARLRRSSTMGSSLRSRSDCTGMTGASLALGLDLDRLFRGDPPDNRSHSALTGPSQRKSLSARSLHGRFLKQAKARVLAQRVHL